MALPQLGTLGHWYSAVQQTSALPTIDDVSGNGNDGVQTGGVTRVQAADGSWWFDFSAAANAEITAGENTPVGVAFTYLLRPARRVGATWPPPAVIFFASPGSSVNLPGLYYDPAQGATGVIRALLDNAGFNTTEDIEPWDEEEPHILGMTHDGSANGTLRVYLDDWNTPILTQTNVDPGVVSAAITWATYNSGQSWRNLISDMAFWRGTELNTSELTQAAAEFEAVNATTLDLTGQADGDATASGSLNVASPLSGQADGSGTADGSLDVATPLSGQSDGEATAAGALNVATPLSGQADGQATVAGDLAVEGEVNLSGQSDGSANVQGSLNVATPLSGQADGAATADGSIDVATPLSGQADGDAAASASLNVTTPLAGQADGTGAASGQLSVDGSDELSGQADGQATASASLNVATPLSGQADGAATATASFTIPFHTAPPERTIGARKDDRRIIATKDRRIMSARGGSLSAVTERGYFDFTFDGTFE